MIDILLITAIRKNANYIVPPIGLLYLATTLRREGFKTIIIDCIEKKYDIITFKKKIEEIRPSIIGIQFFGEDYPIIKEMARIIKEINSEIKIIVGGPQPTTLPKETMSIKEIDFGFIGESEIGLLLLAQKILKNRRVSYSKIYGLIYRENKVKYNPPIFNENLEFGMPSWDLLNPKNYGLAPQAGFIENYPYAPISTSRGCPYNCTYCAVHTISGRKIRKRKIKSVIDEIRYLKKQYGIKEIHIVDDAFTIDKERVREFCNELIKRNLNIKFTFPNGIRLDTLDEELLLLMKKAGLGHFMVGIESGSQKILNDMKKGITIQVIEDKIDLINKVGLKVSAFFIIGYPTETREDIIKTIKFAKKLKIKRAQFSLFQTYPKTEITEELIKKGELKEIDFISFGFAKANYAPPQLTREELKRLQKRAFFEFYLRPKIILGIMGNINSFEHLKYLFKRMVYTIAKQHNPKPIN